MIEVRGVTKRYQTTLAVDQLSFVVRPGQVTGFLGPNGAGKSTTMRVIMGLDRPDTGDATVNGRPYHDLPWPLREVGALLEAKSVHPGRTAFNHLWFLARTNRIPRSRVREVLDLVGLGSVAGRRAGTFSLGMGQRLGIAAALLGDPGVLLFDDPEGIRWVRTLLKHLAAEGRTVLVSSHLMSEMALTADHVVVIGRGRLITEQSVATLVASSSGGAVLVRTPRPDVLVPVLQAAGATRVSPAGDGAVQVVGLAAPQIGDLALANGVAVHELTPQVASLEEAYMALTQGSVEFRVDQPPGSSSWSAPVPPGSGPAGPVPAGPVPPGPVPPGPVPVGAPAGYPVGSVAPPPPGTPTGPVHPGEPLPSAAGWPAGPPAPRGDGRPLPPPPPGPHDGETGR